MGTLHLRDENNPSPCPKSQRVRVLSLYLRPARKTQHKRDILLFPAVSRHLGPRISRHS